MASQGPLFCPFCRECFEGEAVCPEHELPLVSFDRLPARRESDEPAADEPVEAHDPRFGRLEVMLGAALLLLGPALPFISLRGEPVRMVTGYELALHRALNLWSVPLVAMVLFSVLARRRTPAAMQGARLVIPLLALFAAGSTIYTLTRVLRGAEQLPGPAGAATVTVEWGVYVAAAGVLLTLAGGARFGARWRRRR
jgi:hypothetical protein